MNADIPCPKCHTQVGMIYDMAQGGHYVSHLVTRHVCYLDPVDARLVTWMFNNPNWE